MPVADNTTAPTLKPASIAHAKDLAFLVNLAGEGLPYYLWQQAAAPDQDPFAIGEQRAQREQGGFSYRNAWVLDVNGRAVASLVGYPQASTAELMDQDSPDLPAPVRPLVRLEAKAPGSWYVNVLATYKEYRGRGFGNQLMEQAEALARAAGCPSLSLIVAEENTPAKTLYAKRGYAVVAREPIVPFPGCEQSGDWVLMVKAL